MNRDFRYKAKTLETKEWVYGGIHVIKIKNIKHYYICLDKETYFHIEVDPNTICQSTGLYNSTKFENLSKERQDEFLRYNSKEEWKGEEIFENDIVLDSDDLISVISYEDETARFVIEDYDFKDELLENGWQIQSGVFGIVDKNGFDMFNNIEKDMKIVGNIIDNPKFFKDLRSVLSKSEYNQKLYE